jgi:hypothetical protein
MDNPIAIYERPFIVDISITFKYLDSALDWNFKFL